MAITNDGINLSFKRRPKNEQQQKKSPFKNETYIKIQD